MADTFRHDVVLDRHFNVMAVVDYSILTQRLKNENLVHVQTSLAEYFRFLELKIRTSDWNATLLSPSAIVDRVWHLHILDTVRYAEECKRLCGHVIDHNPDGASDGSDRDARYQRTLDHYQIVFRMTPHSEIWPKLQGVAAPAPERARVRENKRKKQEDKVRIQFTAATGRKTVLLISLDATVARCKEAFYKAEGPPVDQLRFVYQGEQLEDGRTLKDYGIAAESNIYVILRLSGC